jgi:hypothetical protein
MAESFYCSLFNRPRVERGQEEVERTTDKIQWKTAELLITITASQKLFISTLSSFTDDFLSLRNRLRCRNLQHEDSILGRFTRKLIRIYIIYCTCQFFNSFKYWFKNLSNVIFRAHSFVNLWQNKPSWRPSTQYINDHHKFAKQMNDKNRDVTVNISQTCAGYVVFMYFPHKILINPGNINILWQTTTYMTS